MEAEFLSTELIRGFLSLANALFNLIMTGASVNGMGLSGHSLPYLIHESMVVMVVPRSLNENDSLSYTYDRDIEKSDNYKPLYFPGYIKVRAFLLYLFYNFFYLPLTIFLYLPLTKFFLLTFNNFLSVTLTALALSTDCSASSNFTMTLKCSLYCSSLLFFLNFGVSPVAMILFFQKLQLIWATSLIT